MKESKARMKIRHGAMQDMRGRYHSEVSIEKSKLDTVWT